MTSHDACAIPVRTRDVWIAIAALIVAPRLVPAQVAPPVPLPEPVALEEPLVTGVPLVHDNDNLPHPGSTLRDDDYSAGG